MSTVSSARSGFVRVPKSWVALDVSPGARVLLFHFCAAANAAGESWYKFAQLTDIVGRSKAAISGYLAELREAGVVETEQQRTANGYHAHLLVRLVAWSDLLAEWSAMADAARRRPSSDETRVPAPTHAQTPTRRVASKSSQRNVGKLFERLSSSSNAEHCVQNAERYYPSDNNYTHIINTLPRGELANTSTIKPFDESWSINDEKDWVYYKAGASGMSFDRRPPSELLWRAIRHADYAQRAIGWCEEAEARVRAASGLREFARSARIAVGDAVDNVAAEIAKRARTPDSIARAIDILRENWAPHWRRLSTPEQVAALLDSEAVKGRLIGVEERAAHRARARASLARFELKRRREEKPSGDALTVTPLAARMVAHNTCGADTAREMPMNGST